MVRRNSDPDGPAITDITALVEPGNGVIIVYAPDARAGRL
jgi:hypothetical protein